MRDLTANSITEKNAQANKPIFLYTIYDYDGSTDLHLAEYDANVTFDSVLYTATPMKHDFVGENTQGEIDNVRVSISNVNRVLQSYLEAYDFRGVKVKITLVWANRLNEPTSKLEDIYYIDNYVASEDTVDFTLSSKFDILDVKIPFGKYFRNTCRWQFKDSRCTYAGVETSCSRTFGRCKELANALRFGGFPSIPTRRLYVS